MNLFKGRLLLVLLSVTIGIAAVASHTAAFSAGVPSGLPHARSSSLRSFTRSHRDFAAVSFDENTLDAVDSAGVSLEALESGSFDHQKAQWQSDSLKAYVVIFRLNIENEMLT